MNIYLFLLLVLGCGFVSSKGVCPKPMTCEGPKPETCPDIIDEVVGINEHNDWDRLISPCLACKWGYTRYYNLESCEGYTGAEECIDEYDPVCGYSNEETGSGPNLQGRWFWKKYRNKCEYCTLVPGKDGAYLLGRCPKVLTASDHIYMA